MTDKKSDKDVLAIVQNALKKGELKYSEHALERMEKRDIKVFEIEQVVKYGEREQGLDEFDKKRSYWRYVIRNKDVEERDLAISVDIEDAPTTIIVTIMQIDPETARKL